MDTEPPHAARGGAQQERVFEPAILVIGAMIVGPEFGPLAAVCAGNVAVALAYGLIRDPAVPRERYFDQAWTSTEQLLLNLSGIVLAGTLTLAVQQRLARRRRPPGP